MGSATSSVGVAASAFSSVAFGLMADFITDALVLSPTRPPNGTGTVTLGVAGGLTGKRLLRGWTDCGTRERGKGAIVRDPIAAVAGIACGRRIG